MIKTPKLTPAELYYHIVYGIPIEELRGIAQELRGRGNIIQTQQLNSIGFVQTEPTYPVQLGNQSVRVPTVLSRPQGGSNFTPGARVFGVGLAVDVATTIVFGLIAMSQDFQSNGMAYEKWKKHRYGDGPKAEMNPLNPYIPLVWDGYEGVDDDRPSLATDGSGMLIDQIGVLRGRPAAIVASQGEEKSGAQPRAGDRAGKTELDDELDGPQTADEDGELDDLNNPYNLLFRESREITTSDVAVLGNLLREALRENAGGTSGLIIKKLEEISQQHFADNIRDVARLILSEFDRVHQGIAKTYAQLGVDQLHMLLEEKFRSRELIEAGIIIRQIIEKGGESDMFKLIFYFHPFVRRVTLSVMALAGTLEPVNELWTLQWALIARDLDSSDPSVVAEAVKLIDLFADLGELEARRALERLAVDETRPGIALIAQRCLDNGEN